MKNCYIHYRKILRFFLTWAGIEPGMKIQGLVSFDENGDRHGMMLIYQFLNNTPTILAYYLSKEDKIEWRDESNGSFFFEGGKPPSDEVKYHPKIYGINNTMYYVISAFSVIGIVLALLCLLFNLSYMNHRFIKMSSPRMNNLIITGCIFSYCSIFLLGLDTTIIDLDGKAVWVCKSSSWVLCLGFTTAFGSMFSKTWRVHVIFTNKKLEKRVIKDWHLYIIVAVLLLIDIIIFICWEIIDPKWTKQVNVINETDPGDVDIVFTYSLTVCKSKYSTFWTGGLYGFKAILILFGIFFVWETRNVRIPALNDSKQIGMCIYNVMVMSIIAVAIVNIQQETQVDISFAVVAVCILVATSCTLILVFIPKMVTVFKGGKEVEDVKGVKTFAGPVSQGTNVDTEVKQNNWMMEEM